MHKKTADFLLSEKKRSLLGKTWDNIKKFVAGAATLGLAHYAAKHAFPKYDAFTTGLYNKKIQPHITAGAGSKITDLRDLAAPLLKKHEDKTITPEEQEELDKLLGKAEEWQKIQQENFNMNKEQTYIKQFIKQLGEKNYSVADKYLQQVVEDKLQAKIAAQYKKQRLY